MNYLKGMKRRVDSLYSKGLSIKEISEKLFPQPPTKALLMEEFSGGEWSHINMVKALLGLE